MKTILVPYDFSKEAEYALNFAIGIAKKTQNLLKLFHVVELPIGQSFNTMGEVSTYTNDAATQIYTIELIEKRKVQMAKLEQTFANQGFEFQTNMVFGNPYAGISKEIADEGADLVIMGSKGASGLEEVLIGSNTEKVVRNVTCPVITIKGPTTIEDIRKIVFASDFNEDAGQVIEKLKALAEVISAELHFVKINTPSLFEGSKNSTQKIRRFVDEYGLKAASIQIYNSGTEEEGILEYADEINADLIAMSTHGRTGFLRLLSGSIAEDVVNSSSRPVWTMKSN
jgi:nucleotide-binding universal stress UspA family protein